jgi:hypothetical protein
VVIKYVYQHFPFQGPPKFTPIGIWGSKLNHLASLALHMYSADGSPTHGALHYFFTPKIVSTAVVIYEKVSVLHIATSDKGCQMVYFHTKR